jgi:choline dehydrogenase-like flavoprotein
MSSLMTVESRGRVMLDDGEARFDFGELSTPGDRVAHTDMAARLVDLADECGFMVHGLAAPAMVSHATSSCASAVDRRGRLLGVDGVTLADASVLASVPPETPAAAVTMEALRIATGLGEELT